MRCQASDLCRIPEIASIRREKDGIKGWREEEEAETNLRPRRLCDEFLHLSQRINSMTSAVTVVLGREKIK